ncbi:leucine--tRNA ligase [Halolamina sediminis]|uniref:leucine--tRNA ligase n=1 Tax=Halolamina sediminis TaxID=1480675 RepID=UPI0006B5474C|nr:leucine--tRNA ligase [Halolamina sediminis]
MDYDPQAIEERWRQRWRENGRYEADPVPEEERENREGQGPSGSRTQSGDATFVTVPYPYPSGGMHIGHARTYTVPDAYARYRRQQGDNVLFPMAWHVTGTPIIGAVERLKKGEEEQLSVLQDTYNVPEEDLGDLETPMGYAEYFIEEHYKKGMKSLGLSVDWRREFTTNDERYSKFIEWQYQTLKEKGLVEKGLHPVNYCTEEEQPVTTHDLLEGEEAEFQEYTLIRFRGDSPDNGDAVFPMATLRPETVRGVTNAYVDPEATYVRATVDGETWVISEDAAEKFRLQDREVEIEAEFDGREIVGTSVENPVTGDDVLILPAGFVDADNATGVVMSVPAHSPDDYVALQELTERADELTEYGIDPEAVREIEPIPILTIEGYGEIPAASAVEEHGIESSDDPALEEATNDLYNAEFHSGVLNDEYGEFAGEVVEDVRDRFREHHAGDAFDTMQEFSEEVVCRCGGDVEVAYQDTWFLRYNDEEWMAKTRRAIQNLDAIPENTRGEYEHTVGWLEEWPCIRNYGLGTRLPWDDEFVIEPLSDSTLYMAYYTVAPHIQDVPVEELDPAFFDAMFYGEDAVDDADERALELGEEWDYWYPVDYRFSGNDLITNHLTFYLYHHAEFFPEPKWPEGIVVMGMGLLEGQKMSSSKGHVVLPGEAISEYGADTVRFFLLNASEPWQDYDWREDAVESTHNQLRRFYNRGQELIEGPEGDRDAITDVDRWLLSKLQTTIETATDAMERSETRTATQAAFYGFDEHLKWYRRRADLDRPGARWTLRHALETRLRLLAPFTPFLANELHEELTGTAAEDAPWPEVDDDLRAPDLELQEARVQALVDDINEVADVTDTDPETIRIYVAADWKRQVFDAVREVGADVGAVMSEVMSDPDLRERGNEVNQIAQDAVEFARDYDEEELADLLEMDEQAAYEGAAPFLAREFDAAVEVYAEDDADVVDPADRADSAIPFRPAIHLA